MRQHLFRLGIFLLSGCVGAIFGAYHVHKIESSKIAALQSELNRIKGELDRIQKPAAVQLDTQTILPSVQMGYGMTPERVREFLLRAVPFDEAILRTQWGDEKGKALYEADKAEMWEMQHRVRR